MKPAILVLCLVTAASAGTMARNRNHVQHSESKPSLGTKDPVAESIIEESIDMAEEIIDESTQMAEDAIHDRCKMPSRKKSSGNKSDGSNNKVKSVIEKIAEEIIEEGAKLAEESLKKTNAAEKLPESTIHHVSGNNHS